ncbi:MAG: hypothetical protein ACE5JX_21455 [Acidobacteriota bacterium]
MKKTKTTFVLCVDNTDYEASLVLGKVYPLVQDPVAAKDDLVRIVDESGEDYLYDRTHFEFVDFPAAVKKKLLALQHPS